MRAWKHSGFHVYAGPTITDKEDSVRVGLYIVRAPASASRLALTEDGLLKYLAKGSIPNDNCDPLFEPNGQTLDPLEWIAKLTMHIPLIIEHKRFATVAAIQMSLAQKQPDGAQLPDHSTQSLVPKEDSESDWIKERKSIWAALIKLIYESDPLLCPKCHTQMKVISLIKDGTVIDKILDHLEYKFDVLPLSARPPPPQVPVPNSDFLLDSPVWT